MNKIIYTLLFMLSFNVFHDSFISLIENKHTHIVESVGEVSVGDCADFGDIHKMLHFMAILTTPDNMIDEHIETLYITHLSNRYTSFIPKTSYRPPIV